MLFWVVVVVRDCDVLVADGVDDAKNSLILAAALFCECAVLNNSSSSLFEFNDWETGVDCW